MTDWFFAGTFDEAFWAVVGKQKLNGRTAAEVLRPLVAEAREPDLSWISKSRLLDALCHLELAFSLKRRGEQINWVLNPFQDEPEASGYAKSIAGAIDALYRASRDRYQAEWVKAGIGAIAASSPLRSFWRRR